MSNKEVFFYLDLSQIDFYYEGTCIKYLVETIALGNLDNFKRGETNNLDAQYEFMQKNHMNMIYCETNVDSPYKGYIHYKKYLM